MAGRLVFTETFKKNFKKLPKEIKTVLAGKIDLFLSNPLHPSLRLKKIKGTGNIWEISISMNYRITLEKHKDSIVFRKVGTHDILNKP